jgi:hypothetical protein
MPPFKSITISVKSSLESGFPLVNNKIPNKHILSPLSSDARFAPCLERYGEGRGLKLAMTVLAGCSLDATSHGPQKLALD